MSAIIGTLSLINSITSFNRRYSGLKSWPHSLIQCASSTAKKDTSNPLKNSMFCTSWNAYNKAKAPMCFRISERIYPLCEDIRRFGTAAYELSLLAEGKIDIYYEATLQPWDLAAGALIVREAGGYCGSIFGPESYDRKGPMIASNSKESFDIIRNIIEYEMNKE